MVTHEPEDERYVDRVIWLQDGLVVRESSSLEPELAADLKSESPVIVPIY